MNFHALKASIRSTGSPCSPIASSSAPMNAGAYRQILQKLERWSRDGWPPGPIVAYAVERGWRTVLKRTR